MSAAVRSASHMGAAAAADPLPRLRPGLFQELFRGYLQRGLAYRFKSPLVWAVLPTLVFTALHWNPAVVLGMNIGVAVSIGAFAALLALLVYATGNLGAAMGAHFGNNIVGFLLISHDDTLGGLALFRAPPLDGLAWTPVETATIAGISIVSILLTWLLLLHPRSPLRVKPISAARRRANHR